MSRPGAATRLLLFACLTLMVAVRLDAQQPPVAAVVKNLSGTAMVLRGGQQLPISPGQTILEGDTIRTDGSGRLGLTLKDGTRLSLGAGTELRIETFAYAPAEGRLALALKLLRGVAGYISGRIAQLSPGAVKIETPSSIIGIRGTHLLIGVDQP